MLLLENFSARDSKESSFACAERLPPNGSVVFYSRICGSASAASRTCWVREKRLESLLEEYDRSGMSLDRKI
jgi:hypothetical protein